MIITNWAGTNYRASTKILVIRKLHILCRIKCEIYMQSGMFSCCTHITPISINGKYMCVSRRKYTPLNSQTSCHFLTSSIMIYAHTAKIVITQLIYWFSYLGLKGFYEEYIHATQTPVRKLELKLCLWQCPAGIPPKTLQQIPEAIFV